MPLFLEAFHVLNQFDIPKGAAREDEKDEHGNIVADYTLWTAASDLKARSIISAHTKTVRFEWWTS